MVHWRKNDAVCVQAGFGSVRFVDAGGSCSQIENFDDGTSQRSGIPAVPAANIISSDSPLPVGRAGQRDQRVLTGDIVFHLHGITHRINIRDGGFHTIVDQDTALHSLL